MNKSKTLPIKSIGFVLLSFLILIIFLSIIVYLKVSISATNNENSVIDNILNREIIYSPNTELDPMIMHVPEEFLNKRKEEQIFISSVDPWKGDLNGSVEIVFFASLGQEESQQVKILLDELLEKYPQDLKVFWKDFSDDQEARKTAGSAHCAGEQDKFWEAIDLLMDKGTTDYSNLGTELNLDNELWQRCLDIGEGETIAQSGYYYGKTLNIEESPVLYINSQRFEEEINFENLNNYINEAIN